MAKHFSVSSRARKAAVVVVAAVAAVGLVGCSETAAVDKVGLYYTGGPFQGQHFKKVVESGSGTTWMGAMDHLKWMPAGQRNYIISKKETEGDRRGSDFLRVPAKGGVAMDFEVSVYFKVNTHTDDIKDYKGGTLRLFYEQICKKYGCDDDGDGWDRMLNDNFRKIIEGSVRSRVFNFTVDELYANLEGTASGNRDAIQLIQEDIAKQLKVGVNTTLGGEFFCGPTFTRDKKECPDFQFVINSAEPADQAVRDSFAQQRVAANGKVTAENQAQADVARANGTRAQQDALKGSLSPEYLELKRIEAMDRCAGNTNCTLVITQGQGGTVNVNAGK